MNKPALTVASIITAFALIAVAHVASAAHGSRSPIPDVSGTYDDPDHPGVKVRVFVHPEPSRGAHPERPTKDESSVLVCNLADPDSSAVAGAAGWKLPSAWTYNLNPSSVPSSVGGSNLPTIVGNGFADWTAAAGNKVTFTKGPNTSVTRQAYDQKNVIAWGRTSGSALGVTYIRYYTSTGQVVDVDTIMNKKFPWKWSTQAQCAESTAYDAENIMNHELGHWLGLDDMYTATYVDNTMYGYGSKGEVKKNTLTTGDNAGTAAIYN